LKIIEVTELLNTPIEYKKIKESDFIDINNISKEIVSKDSEGYVLSDLNSKINLLEKDTTIINIGVGLGKSTAIIDIIRQYHNMNSDSIKYKIIMITPYKTLNKQYINAFKEIFEAKNIHFDYEDIDANNWNENQVMEDINKPLQIFTINTILEDSGQEGVAQNANKNRYIKELIENCKINNIKVVMVLDELHETLDNFDKNKILLINKWNEVVHKVFLASATFSESCIPILKVFSLMTNKNVKIFETERIQNRALSDLNLILYRRQSYDFNDSYLKLSFNEILMKDFSAINILCYSKVVSENLYKSAIGDNIKIKYGSLNLCFGNSKITFKRNECNIGTTFKTGISIDEEETAFVIILPPTSAKDNGIFNDKLNSITQAIARARSSSSEIYIIMPAPKVLIKKASNENNTYVNNIISDNLIVKEYVSIDSQQEILREEYRKKISNIQNQIEDYKHVEEDLKEPIDKFDWFRLKEGDKILSNNYDVFGKDLSSYIYWAAYSNQFTNCKLKRIISKGDLCFENKGSYLNTIINEVRPYFTDHINICKSHKEKYFLIRDILFSNYLNEGENCDVKIEKRKMNDFERQIINSIKYIENNETTFYNDEDFTKEDYLRNAMIYCSDEFINENNPRINIDDYRLIKAYNDLFKFKELLCNYVIEKEVKSNTKYFFPMDKSFNFSKIDEIKLSIIYKDIFELDDVFKNLFWHSPLKCVSYK